MRELSLNVLDVAQNSIAAKAGTVEISVDFADEKKLLEIIIADDGCGMSPEALERVVDPFFTTRTTRHIGMGIPLFKMAAEMTGGNFDISSVAGEGTKVKALFKTDSIDMTPLGDMSSTMVSLITMNEQTNFIYTVTSGGKSFELTTLQLKEILGDVPLSTPEVSAWLKEYLDEQNRIVLGGAV